MPGDRSNTATVIAISAIAYALADMVHEALGHGLLSLLVPGVKAISISTVALNETGSSRIVAAAGMIANIITGGLSLWLFAKRRQVTNGSYFLWLFAGVNLMDIGYLLYSGVLRYGDWYDVIAGLPLEPLWRVALIVAGIAGYIGVMRFLYAAMASQIRRSALDGRDVRRAVIISYFAGSALVLLGAAFNPIKQLIWLSGLAVGFVGTFGFFGVAGWIEHVGAEAAARPAVRFSAMWIIFGAVVAAAFVLILGPGVRLSS